MITLKVKITYSTSSRFDLICMTDGIRVFFNEKHIKIQDCKGSKCDPWKSVT